MGTMRGAAVVLLLVWAAAGADSVTQSEDNAVISEGDPLQLNCTYKLPGSPYLFCPYLFWYVQYPGQPPRMLLRDLGGQDSDEGTRKGFGATHDKKNKSFHLRKASVELSDAATYYCAGS
uniref:Ig-like domain-containing protein n=1 Tax=Pelodiscus sinensis TaxID=13735 RepID=K7FAL7_PELSI